MTNDSALLSSATDMRILAKQDDIGEFRAAVREWLAGTVAPDAMQQMIDADEEEGVRIQREWMAARHKVGLGTPHWPREYGGADLSANDRPGESRVVVSLQPVKVNTWGS